MQRRADSSSARSWPVGVGVGALPSPAASPSLTPVYSNNTTIDDPSVKIILRNRNH